MEIVARAPADGYTIVSAAVGSWAVTPHFNKLPYDTQTDFAPIIQIATTPGVLVVHPSVAAKTVQDLIALARQKPGALNYAAGGLGGYSHVSAELFNSMTKIRMSGVPYKGAAPAMTELIGGHTQVMFNTGLGLIAEALAPRCKAFGMTVLGVTATPRPVEGFDRVYVYEQLAQAAALADFLVVLTPYSPERDKLIDAKILAAMKPGAFLLNLARGGLCDESALLDALRSKRIAGANGSPGHLAGELFKQMAGVSITHVPYKGGAQAMTDMMSGQVQLIFESMSSISPHHRAGRLRGIAVTGLKRSPNFPDLPTIAEAGGWIKA